MLSVMSPVSFFPSGNVHLTTQEEARSHLESSQNVALLFPSKPQVLDCCRNLVNEQKVLTVVQETSSFLSMVENVAKVVDFLGDKQKYLQRIYRLLPPGDQLRSRDLIYFAYDLCKSAGEQFEVPWVNDVTWDDLILPVQTLRKHKVEETLRSHAEVRYVAVGQRNGCLPIHQPGDVTTLRISYTSTSVLPQQSRRFLEDILANIKEDDIQEALFRSFVPWKNNGFMDLHETGIDTTIIDIAGFDDAHRTVLVETLTALNICFFVPFRNKLFIPGTGHFINQLRLALLRTDIHLPTGMKQGSFQLTCWKSTRIGLHKKHRVFLCQTSSVGGLSTIPMQAEFLQQSHVFQELSAMQSQRELLEHPVGQYLRTEYNADNLAINFTRSHRGNCRVLTFDIPSTNKQKFPQPFVMQKETIQVAHRGGLPRDQAIIGPTVYSETNREHWDNVIQRGMPGGLRKNVLIPDKASIHSSARFDQLTEHIFTIDETWYDITLGKEDAPFIFSPAVVPPQTLADTMIDLLLKTQVGTPNSSFLESLEKGEVRWCHPEQMSTVNILSSNNWRIFCLRTLPRQSIQLKHICHRRDKFTIISNSSLSVLNFEPTTICQAIPPGIAPKLMITPWNCVQLIGCGVVVAKMPQQIIDPAEDEHASRFSIDNHSKGTFKRSYKQLSSNELEKSLEINGDQEKGETRTEPIEPARIEEDIMEDDAFSFWGYGSIASEDEAQEPHETGSNVNNQQVEAQLGHLLLDCSNGDDADNVPPTKDRQSTKPTLPAETKTERNKHEPVKQGGEPTSVMTSSSHQVNHVPVDVHPEPATKAVTSDQKAASLGHTSKRVSKGNQSQVKAKSGQPTVLQQLQKNGDQQLIEHNGTINSQREPDVELVSVTEATGTVVRGDIKTHLQTVFYQWTDTFIRLNFHDVIDVALVIYMEPDKYIAPALMALRTLSANYPKQQVPSTHLRDYLLYAAFQHWTPHAGEIQINGVSFSLVEASLAIASYNLLPTKLVVPGEPLSLWLTVFSNIGQPQEKIFSGTTVKCSSCERQEVVTSYFHTTTLSIHDFIQQCNEDMITNTSPVFDRQLYPSDIFHTTECQRKTGLTTFNQDPGLLRFILLDQKYTITDTDEMSRLAEQLHSLNCGKFSFSRLILQDPTFQDLKLVEIVMGQLCEYTGKEYQLLTSLESLTNHLIYGIVFHTRESLLQELPPLDTPHPPKVDEKHRVKQTICKMKRFQPDTYQSKLATTKKNEAHKEASQSIVPCVSKSTNVAKDFAKDQAPAIASSSVEESNQSKGGPQPGSQLDCMQAHQEVSAPVVDPPSTTYMQPTQLLHQSEAQTMCPPVAAPMNANTQPPVSRGDRTAGERHQNKSPPRSPVHQHEQPKKSKVQESSIIPVVLISLFDGIGSVLPTFVQRFRAHPAVYIAAEQDEELRQLISIQTGLRLDGQWTRLASGTIGIYLSDVVKLVDFQCRILREAAALCPNGKWLIVSGSPCQDLTYAGRYKGLLGITGKRSVFFLVTQHTIWWLTYKFGKERVRFLCENAGSMQEKHKSFFLWSLGLPTNTDKNYRTG